jgi:hypothetical protein
MEDPDEMRAIGAAVAALALNPYPREGFHRGEYHRLRVGRFRGIYVVEEDVITVERAGRAGGLGGTGSGIPGQGRSQRRQSPACFRSRVRAVPDRQVPRPC